MHPNKIAQRPEFPEKILSPEFLFGYNDKKTSPNKHNQKSPFLSSLKPSSWYYNSQSRVAGVMREIILACIHVIST